MSKKATEISMIFVCCVRNAASHLQKSLANIDAFASNYKYSHIVIVENDSEDGTRQLLEVWASLRHNVHIINLDGLIHQHPTRTHRLAAARNEYLKFIRNSDEMSSFDYLVVSDLDDVLVQPVNLDKFKSAIEWLEKDSSAVGIFANSYPVYYDVWALRHATWSPDDCIERVQNQAPTLGIDMATHRYIYDRQIPISLSAAPIEVESAFGGIGIYRMTAALSSYYDGVRADGGERCEHVEFNFGVRAATGGKLLIFPSLAVEAPTEHYVGAMRPMRIAQLEQGGKSCEIVVPEDHALDHYRSIAPLYDRRLPMLANILSITRPTEVFIDVGGNVGDTATLARLQGCEVPIVSIEASLTFYKFMIHNLSRNHKLLHNVEPVWGLVGAQTEAVQMQSAYGTAHTVVVNHEDITDYLSIPKIELSNVIGSRKCSLLKIDTDGFDQDIIFSEMAFVKNHRPIIWAECQTKSSVDEGSWKALFCELSEYYEKIIVFDNFGFAVLEGSLREKAESAIDFMAYCRRQRAHAPHMGDVRTFYSDLILFPHDFENVYRAFVAMLTEIT